MPACRQRVEYLRLGVSERTHGGANSVGEVGQHCRIGRVGLGQRTGGPGKVANLARVDHHHRQRRSSESRLRKAEIGVRVANPSRVRAFAKACGYEAKTDPRDAQVLSRYGQVFPESDTPETEPEREELQDLLRRRRQLVEQRAQEVNRLDKGASVGVAESTKRHIAWLEAEIAQLEKEYQEVLQGSARLTQRAALYRTVPGVGTLTAATLVAFLPELGRWDSKALTSLVGLAPWSRDSGRKRGQRSIRGGRGVVRKALYLCACSVIQVEGELRLFYQNLRQRGKPGNVALVAVMRKLLLQLNALARRGSPWVPSAV